MKVPGQLSPSCWPTASWSGARSRGAGPRAAPGGREPPGAARTYRGCATGVASRV